MLQGDPLSGILFNMVIDQVMRQIPDYLGFQLDENTLVNSMGFADDLNAITSTREGMRCLLQILDKLCPKWGLKFNAAKCRYLCMEADGRNKKMKVSTDCMFVINGSTIELVGVCGQWKYLGVYFSNNGIEPPKQMLNVWLGRLKAASLKPQQKFFILRNYRIPRLLYPLKMSPLSVTALNRLDGAIRKALTGTTGMLHLPSSTPKSFFYASVADGGLGVLCLRYSVPSMIVGRFEKLSTSNSSVVQAAIKEAAFAHRIGVARKFVLKVVGQDILAGAIRSYHRELLDSFIDTKGLVEAGKCPSVHTWVSDGTKMMTGENYCEALKIIVNALPSLSRTQRGMTSDRSCRAGCKAPKTNCYVLQNCHKTHDIRVERHDRVHKRLSAFLSQRGETVNDNMTFVTMEGWRKPDVVFTTNEGTAHVVDVQIVGEYKDLDTLHKM